MDKRNCKHSSALIFLNIKRNKLYFSLPGFHFLSGLLFVLFFYSLRKNSQSMVSTSLMICTWLKILRMRGSIVDMHFFIFLPTQMPWMHAGYCKEGMLCSVLIGLQRLLLRTLLMNQLKSWNRYAIRTCI